MKVRLVFVHEEEVCECEAAEGESYADLLLSCGVVPDTVLIRREGRFLCEDDLVSGGETEIISTCSRG